MPAMLPPDRSVTILEGASRRRVAVQVARDLLPAAVESAENVWHPHRLKSAKERQAEGRDPEHAHWDWTAKTDPVRASDYRFVAVVRDPFRLSPTDGAGCPFDLSRAVLLGEYYEGLMAIWDEPHEARLKPEPLLYVDFLEVAPWNSRELTDSPRYAGVGSLLMREAVAMSVGCGWEGRVGLQALPQAEGFYLRLGMTMVEKGKLKYGHLSYFEFNLASAKMLLRQGEKS